MLRRTQQQRAGFTLIEMLVVIAIIAILMSLLVAAAMKAMDVSPRAETAARLSAINSGIGTYKSSASFGQVKYIPPGRYENGQWLAFRLRNAYPEAPGEPDQYSFEAQYLQQVFGGGRGLDLTNLGYPGLRGDLDANQTLTFFLTGIPQVSGPDVLFTGFSANPQRPFTPRASPDETRKGPMVDLGGKRKYDVDTQGFSYMIDAFGNPLVYFAAYDGQPNKFYGGYNPRYPAARAYSRGGQFENPSGYQLISAGKDARFGITGDWVNVGTDGEDDQANFSSANLGRGPN